MDVIAIARELGKAIQQDDRYIAYMLAKQANDEDTKLQGLINGFDRLRVELQMEVGKPDRDNDKIAELNEAIKSTYKRIMSDPKMLVYEAAKTGYDQLMSQVNTVISMSGNGVDPDEFDLESTACSGSCAGCSGCG